MMVKLFDTTLRDGAQTEGISFTVEDKIKIARLLDSIGVHYIEGGWPGSNPKDIAFFEKIKDVPLKNSTIVAFSSTRRAGIPVEEDKNISTLIEADTKAVSIFGKSWDFHVTEALHTTLEENLLMIYDTVRHLKSKGKEVIYDAEHFFDGYKANPQYAIRTLKEAERAGADVICLCDTNGGTLAFEVQKIIKEVNDVIKTPLGIHAHNDCECAVSVTEMAVYCGVTHVQGTVNGYGERCGNANLCSIIPILKLKLGIDCITDVNLKRLTEISRHVSEIANLPLSGHQPFVGRSAFTHKGGIHVSAVMKHTNTYEHISPEAVGNERRVTVSELSGISNLVFKAKEFGADLKKESPQVRPLLAKLKTLEHQGYQFEEGEASFEILIKKEMGLFQLPFKWHKFEVNTVKTKNKKMEVEAKVEIMLGRKLIRAKGHGNGPVNALDEAVRGTLSKRFPVINEVKLTDYKVRVLDSTDGTAAKVRVLIESADEKKTWGTVGVSSNVIEASWLALIDSFEYKLMIEGVK
ncbi:MAG: citramalate synthase [Candidatus Saganbacteria bacterium]|nr:citramalate synthase [Candidatus Saganbacteria bacterium]